MTKKQLKKLIREEIKSLNEGRYEVEYYDIRGGHGDAGKSSNFKGALKQAIDLYKREKKQGFLGTSTGYIGVDSNDEFAVVYITKEYLNNISSNDFGSPDAKSKFIEVAKKALQTGKPQTGKYPS